MDYPHIRTQRLELRPPGMDDFPEIARLLASPRSIWMGGPYDTRTAWGIFCHDLAQWQLFGHGALMIQLVESRQCIGQVSINHGPLFPEKELGWFLYDGHEGMGYATEAGRALREWALANLRLPSLVSYIAPENVRSQAVAQRLGGVQDPLAPRKDPKDLVYRYTVPKT